MNKKKILLFGASGAIGGALGEWFLAHQYDVICFSRQFTPENTIDGVKWFSWNPKEEKTVPSGLCSPVDAVVWAQGANCNDNIANYDRVLHEKIYYANVGFILDTLHSMIEADIIATPCRMIIVSSIWQEIARQNKLSYTISKAALKGLVHSLSIDLGRDGHLVNAVLPGALDTPMTRENLSGAQIKNIEKATPLSRLPRLDDVCQTVGYLCSSDNTSVTGQFITVDGGFSYAKII